MRGAYNYFGKTSDRCNTRSRISSNLTIILPFLFFFLSGWTIPDELVFCVCRGADLALPAAEETIIIDENFETDDFREFSTATEQTRALPPVQTVRSAVPVTQTAKVPTEIAPEKPVDKLVEEPVKEPVEEPLKKPVEEALVSSAGESAESLSTDSGIEYSIDPSPEERQTTGHRGPLALLERLEPLCGEAQTKQWAQSLKRRLILLSDSLEADNTIEEPVLDDIYELYNYGLELGKKLNGDPLALSVFRICYGIKRRYSIWSQYSQNEVLDMDIQPSEPTSAMAPPSTLPLGLADVPSRSEETTVPLQLNSVPETDAMKESKTATDSYAQQLYKILNSTAEGKSWVRFFHLTEFAGVPANTHGRKLLLIQVLSNLNSPLTVQQASFLSDSSIVRFTEAMQRELRLFPLPIDLLESLERFELSPEPSQSEQLGMILLQQKLSGGTASQAVPYLENSYRNANIRFDVSQKLLNRLAPSATQLSKPVNDIIMNRHVRGSSITHTRPQLRLIPDPKRFQAVIDLEGSVSSSTVTNDSGITFQQRSDALFRAQLPVILSVRGIVPSDPIIRVSNQTRLQSVRTGVDIIPIVGSIVQEAARSQHQQYSSMASSEVEQKIAAQVRQELAAQANVRIGQINQNWEQKVGRTLKQLGIEMSPIDAQTNTESAVLRFRVAGHDQLGASSPRPQATAGALLNLQVHDSLCNNVVQRLNINGKTFRPAQLREFLAQKLNLAMENRTSEGEDRLALTFAKENPIWVHFDGDCLNLQLSFDEIVLDDQSFENIKVLVKYVEESAGMNITLERRDVVQIIGRCGIGKQITLRAIFSKVFSLQKSLAVTPKAILEDPRWNGVGVAQFDLTDGWLAVTLAE